MTIFLTVFLLLFVSMSCAWGAFSTAFSANILQRIAMAVLAILSVTFIKSVIEVGSCSPAVTVGATAVAFYALGTIMKTNYYKPKRESSASTAPP